MSGINSAMLAGVTGLSANSAALASISDDIANVNTIGYKANLVQFSDLVTNSGSGYASGGVQAVATQNVAQQGVLQASSSPTDLAISGNGFFVTTQNAATPNSVNAPLFTRAGSFTPNSQGYLVNSAGLYLQGWLTDTNGNITSDPSNLSLLSPINVNSISSQAVPTTAVTVNANLQSSQEPSQAVADMGSTTATDGYDPTSATNSMASGNVKPDFTMQLPISNTQGGTQTLQVDFLKSATPNQWYAEIVAAPGTVQGTAVPNQVASGIVAFDDTGQFDPTKSTLPLSLAFGPSSPAPATGSFAWATNQGIGGQTVQLNFAGTAGLSQNDGVSAVTNINANGTPTGSLTSVQVDTSGDVTAVFSNGANRKIAQLAVATFTNPDGLTAVSGDAYQTSQQSGNYNLKVAGVGGAGTLSASKLEASTVDLSQEFTSMITTQRAYSASSKIITTADSMLQDLIQIIR